ncbi:MAG: hypothetical protein QG608_3249 [Actinomycetota bacterium]|nr:hypothetical protein [Actinomycetota bacterium]
MKAIRRRRPARAPRPARPPGAPRAPGALRNAGILLLVVGVTWGAQEWRAAPEDGTAKTPLLWTPMSETVVCPGPETLTVPEGGRPVRPPGPVVVGALAAPASGTAEDREAPAVNSASLSNLDGRGSVDLPRVLKGAGLLVSPREGPGAVRLLSRGKPGTGDEAEAPLVAATQLTLARTGELRGLVGSACAVPSADQWLVGGGTAVGRRARLLLANPTAAAVMVDITVHGPSGPVEAAAGDSVVVAPGRQRALFLDALAPDLQTVAVHVCTHGGRVAALLHDSLLRGVIAGGVDDVVAGNAPALRQLVPGISVEFPSGGSARSPELPRDPRAPGAGGVRVVVPGQQDAVVRVRLSGPGGETALPGGGVVTVRAGASVDVPLTGVPEGVYTAVVESDVPVGAGAFVGRARAGSERALGAAPPPGTPAAELAWVPSAGSVHGSAAVALPAPAAPGRAGPVQSSALLTLMAPLGGARVRVFGWGSSGRGEREQRVDVPAGRTVTVPVRRGTTGLSLEVESGNRVVGAVVLTVGDTAGELVSVIGIRPDRPGGAHPPEVVQDPALGVAVGPGPARGQVSER